MKMQMALACMAAILVAHGDVGRKAEAFRSPTPATGTLPPG